MFEGSNTGAAGPGRLGPMAVMTLGEHLEELRRRVLRCVIVLAAAALVCWVLRHPLLEIVKRPHVAAMKAYDLDTALNYKGYFEPLVAQVKLCVVAALVIAAPYIIYQAWAFLAPGLFPHERNKVVRLGAASLLCFAAGLCFGYFLFVPLALRYMVGLAGPGTRPVLMIGEYLSLFVMLTFAMGVAFQTPVVVYHLIRWKVITVESFQRSRKPVILAGFVIGAVLTPPDPLTQIMMAVTLVALYDVGGLLGAPSWSTLLSFARFTGVAAVVLIGAAVWYTWWPVAEVLAVRGTVTVRGAAMEDGGTAKLRRGESVRTGETGSAVIRMGPKRRVSVYAAEGALVRVHAAAVSIVHGNCLIDAKESRAALEATAGPGGLNLSVGAVVELKVPDPRTVEVTVLEGEADVRATGQEKTIAAGEGEVFRAGGTPRDLSAVRERWQERFPELGADAEPEPAPEH